VTKRLFPKSNQNSDLVLGLHIILNVLPFFALIFV
jgi:hypothetical protein